MCEAVEDAGEDRAYCVVERLHIVLDDKGLRADHRLGGQGAGWES